MTLEILLCTLLSFFTIGALTYLHTVCRDKRILYIRQVSYDAVAYSTELSADIHKRSGEKVSPDMKLSFAVRYMQSIFPLMHKLEAERYCISILGKTVATGATGGFKI